MEQLNRDIEETKLTIPMDVIKDMSIEAFRAEVVSAVRNAAYKYLCTEKLRMSKIMDVNHTKFEFQSYLNPSVLDIHEAKLMFQLRSRMVDVKTNYSNRYDDTLCPVCKVENDTQEHVFKCTKLLQSKCILVASDILYTDIFISDVKKQIAALRMFSSLWTERKKILKIV